MRKNTFPKNAAIFLGLVIYLCAVVWRIYYIFVVHLPLNFIYSDMQGYFDGAKNIFDPNYTPGLGDTVLPQGTAFFFGLLRLADPTWHLAAVVQCLLSALVPLFLAAIADELHGRRAALVTLVLASLYFPFVDYSAYILSENPCLFFMTFGTWLLVCGLKSQRKWAVFIWALLAGLSWGVAAALKMAALSAAIFLGAGFLFIAIRNSWRRPVFILIGALIGLSLIVVPISIRSTRLGEGRPCIIAHQFGYNFLLGHYGDLGLTTWKDDPHGLVFAFGSPSAGEREYRNTLEIPFGPYDTWENCAYAWGWVRQHPFHALRLSLEHDFDLFTGMTLWPTGCSGTPQRMWIRFSQNLYWIFILLPACFYVWLKRRSLSRFQIHSVGDLIAVLPVAALLVVVFFATGEPRYRIPFDGFVILLAARFYTTETFLETIGRKKSVPVNV